MVATVVGVHHQLPYLSCSHRKRISFYYFVVLLRSRSKEKRYDEGNKTETTPETLSLFLFCRRLSFIERSLRENIQTMYLNPIQRT